MMVAIAPNWADVEGRVAAVAAPDERPGFVLVSLDLTAARAVEGFISMVKPEDPSIQIYFPEELARELGLAPGQRFALRVRRGGPEKVFFIHREHVRRLDP